MESDVFCHRFAVGGAFSGGVSGGFADSTPGYHLATLRVGGALDHGLMSVNGPGAVGGAFRSAIDSRSSHSPFIIPSFTIRSSTRVVARRGYRMVAWMRREWGLSLDVFCHRFAVGWACSGGVSGGFADSTPGYHLATLRVGAALDHGLPSGNRSGWRRVGSPRMEGTN